MRDEAPASMGRRRFLGSAIGAAGVTAAGGTAAATTGTGGTAGDRTTLLQEDDNGVDDENDENGENDADDENGEEEDEPELVEIEVGDNGGNWFDPDYVEIEPGTRVRWFWTGNLQHNIEPTAQPDGADWEGHPDLKDSGDYEFTFEVEGTYEYTCTPHPGMDGTIVVTTDPGGEEPEVAPAIPEGAMTLGIATSFALVATLGFAYVFLKFGGNAPDEE